VVIALTAGDLVIAAALVVVLGGLSWRMGLGLTTTLTVAAVRTTVQLLLIGLVLEVIFSHSSLFWVGMTTLVMWGAASFEVFSRQKTRLQGGWGMATGAVSMFVSSFSILLLTLAVIVQPQPWYQPQYAVPLLGMLLGNTMNGVALAMDHLLQQAKEQHRVIEQRLMLGASAREALLPFRREAMRHGMIPMINAMAAAGLVSLPGMMTGQILAGVSPITAVQYQILIMFLITAAVGLGSATAVVLASSRLFDERHRLRLERLRGV